MKQKRMMSEYMNNCNNFDKPASRWKSSKNVKQGSRLRQDNSNSTNKQRYCKTKLDQFSCLWPHKRALQGHQRTKTPFSQITWQVIWRYVQGRNFNNSSVYFAIHIQSGDVSIYRKASYLFQFSFGLTLLF